MNDFKRCIERFLWEISVNGMAAWKITPPNIRNIIYRSFGIKTNAWRIKHSCYFEAPWVSIGKGVYINDRCNFHGPIEIGENTYIAMDVLFSAITHEMGDTNKRAGIIKYERINVGKGCWIGARAIILPGVTIGEGCIIAAGAVVTKDCAPNGLYAGIPAKRIKDLTATTTLRIN